MLRRRNVSSAVRSWGVELRSRLTRGRIKLDPTIVTWIWIAVGVLLIAAEIFVPGLVLVFGGVAAIAVGILRAIGLFESIPLSFLVWMVSSVLLVVAFRKTLMKVAPSEEKKGGHNEDTRAFGKVVDVLETCSESTGGRIRFEGTTWKARCLDGTIQAGSKARIVFRENLEWVIETAAVDAVDEDGPKGLPAAGETGLSVPVSTAEKTRDD